MSHCNKCSGLFWYGNNVESHDVFWRLYLTICHRAPRLSFFTTIKILNNVATFSMFCSVGSEDKSIIMPGADWVPVYTLRSTGLLVIRP